MTAPAKRPLGRFFEHNAESRVVEAEWLNVRKRPITTEPPHEWSFLRFVLEDGTAYTLAAADVAEDERRPEWRL